MKAFTLVLMNQKQSASCWEKNICSILPARRESNTFPARRRDNNVSQEGRFCLIIAEGRKKKKKKKARVRPINYIINFYINYCALLLNFTLLYVSQEGSVLRTDIPKNNCRWLLSMNPEDSAIGSDVSGKVYLHQKSHSGFEVYPDTEFSPLDFGFVFF